MELHLKKTDLVTFSLIAAIWLYSNVFISQKFYNNYKNNPQKTRNRLFIEDIDNATFLINTQGCFIPNYGQRMIFLEDTDRYTSCGKRAVFIKKTSDENIIFQIDTSTLRLKYAEKVKCCYQYISRDTYGGKEDNHIKYSKCLPFNNGTTAKLKSDFINVLCKNAMNDKIVYNDAYMLIKKVDRRNTEHENEKTWNVLMLGLDTMSRARLYNNMPQTAKYLKTQGWLDYRGYHKIASNTFPNLVAILTGKKLGTINKACLNRMSDCNELFMWSKFRDSGYVTAYGEDFINLPDTFSRSNGYKIPPTDHYTRPFFLNGEAEKGNLICTKTMPSAYHILNYALAFSSAYKKQKNFGFFWLNSFTHNINQIPRLLDEPMVYFLKKLRSSGSLENTFVFFLSDHGIRFGETRLSVEAYFEERLPMLFIWVPRKFIERNSEHYYNLISNQIKLTTPYDLHETLWNILQISNSSIKVPQAEACSNCTSLFNDLSDSRTCEDVSISRKWCSCHVLVYVNQHDKRAKQIIKYAASELQNKTKHAKTTKCTICSPLTLDKVLRIHKHIDDDSTFYVVAFAMQPGNLKFEVNLKEDNNTGQLEILKPTYTISRYNSKGYCVKNPFDRDFCVCENVCKKKKKHKKTRHQF